MAAINIKINIGTGQSVAGEALTIANQALAAATGVPTMSVANNLTTTEAGYVLDARQGKILKDNVKGLEDDVFYLKNNIYFGDKNTNTGLKFAELNVHFEFTYIYSIHDNNRKEIVINGMFNSVDVPKGNTVFYLPDGFIFKIGSVVGNLYNLDDNYSVGVIYMMHESISNKDVLMANIDIKNGNYFFEIKYRVN